MQTDASGAEDATSYTHNQAGDVTSIQDAGDAGTTSANHRPAVLRLQRHAGIVPNRVICAPLGAWSDGQPTRGFAEGSALSWAMMMLGSGEPRSWQAMGAFWGVPGCARAAQLAQGQDARDEDKADAGHGDGAAGKLGASE